MMNEVSHYLSRFYNTPWGQKTDTRVALNQEQREGETDDAATD